MNSLLSIASIGAIPIAKWVNAFFAWLTGFAGFFNAITLFLNTVMNGIQWVFDIIPIWLFIVIILLGTWFLFRKTKHWGFMLFELLGFLLIWNQGYWREMTQTLDLVLTTCLLIIIIGVPLGTWMAKSKIVQTIVSPIMSFLQTMPAFVYLIPAVALFGIGQVPGVFASVIFSIPPIVNMTNLGIRQVPSEYLEVSESFGCTAWQKLFKVQFPLAKPTVMSGINQGIMLALSMVVIASMIGTMGLGEAVYFAVGRNDVGTGFAAGIAIVILAIVLDKISKGLGGANKTDAGSNE
ncbi:ABC transporter permease [Fructilactobacillus fructivorans]|uniref:Glycine betaine ABC transport system, permease protein OpuAB n=1 Tax=Fructilactobacillus fructivorans TaxID=1614 RepID=A0A0C1PMJ8_9LACO|nr:proline/glycine betaine ABC transporter permease [Fructilactobacillus fructivorans]KID41982.1 Glycine betaine ABC transport system, permease protein OpuAB [Fructilactobacillus fructivorans]